MAYDDYLLAPCGFCGALSFQDCVITRGKNTGKRKTHWHAQRGYAYWRSVSTPIKEHV